MGYQVVPQWQRKYGPIKGLEGPFQYPSGRVLYYDVKVGEYWDPSTDFYVDADEVSLLKNQLFDKLK